MQGSDYPETRDLVLVGGGHCHALVLRRWAMAPLPGVRLTLIDPEPTAPYTGMLPGLIAGHYQPQELQIDLVRLARSAGARLILGRASGIDHRGQRVRVPGRADIAYDVLSLDIGVTSDMPDLPGFSHWAAGAKPLGQLAAQWQAFLARPRAEADLVVLGAGVAGVELALAMAERLRVAGWRRRITLVEAGPVALAAMAPAARRRLLARLRAEEITVELGARAVAVEAAAVVLTDGRRIAADFTLGAAGARAQEWLAGTDLTLRSGFVLVGPTLQSLNDPRIFAVGDCAELQHAPRPKAGVFAVRQAPVLYDNLRALLRGAALRTYQPQRNYLKLVSLGGKSALADTFGLAASGAWAWRWKDRIDRRFMARFAALPPTVAPALPGQAAEGLAELLAERPLCGGCGAKVGASGLRAALALVPASLRADVVSGPGDDAAVLRHGAGFQVMTTDHLRAVTSDPWLMARIAAIHALGDIWAMGARPQVALAQVILPRMSLALQARTLAEITQAATAVFLAEGADLVGGHTSLGAELTIGFTITGLCANTTTGKRGAQAGDALILTKPLGTGVILAAEMSGSAAGEVVAAAWQIMQTSQGAAAAVLAEVARAMTDVTGFGLAGHLAEMLGTEPLGATLDLMAVPLMDGAEALAGAGVRSSLFDANRALDRLAEVPQTARADLLFDPQTCGGLLAAVPGPDVAGVLARLAAAGCRAAVIGQVTDGFGPIRLR